MISAKYGASFRSLTRSELINSGLEYHDFNQLKHISTITNYVLCIALLQYLRLIHMVTNIQ